MRKNIIINSLVLILSALPLLSIAQESNIVHSSESYQLNSNGTVEITNKFGHLNVQTWDNDSVYFEISLNTAGSTPQDIESLKQNVRFDLTGDGTYRSANVQVNKEGLEIVNKFKKIASLDTENRVNITVILPETATLKINHEYGNVDLPDFRGNIYLNLNQGNVLAGELMGTCYFNLSYGRALIDYVNTGEFTLKYFDVETTNGTLVAINSKYSDFKADHLNEARLNTSRGTITLNDVNTISGYTQFSELIVTKLNLNANLDMKYGSLSQLVCMPGVAKVDIVSKSAPIQLRLANEVQYDINVNTKRATVKNTANISWNTMPSYSNSTEQLKGTTTGSMGKTTINISSQDAKVNLD